jgi:hypothetical protein
MYKKDKIREFLEGEKARNKRTALGLGKGRTIYFDENLSKQAVPQVLL